jgi:hypothetical protein
MPMRFDGAPITSSVNGRGTMPSSEFIGQVHESGQFLWPTMRAEDVDWRGIICRWHEPRCRGRRR